MPLLKKCMDDALKQMENEMSSKYKKVTKDLLLYLSLKFYRHRRLLFCLFLFLSHYLQYILSKDSVLCLWGPFSISLLGFVIYELLSKVESDSIWVIMEKLNDKIESLNPISPIYRFSENPSIGEMLAKIKMESWLEKVKKK